MLTQTRNCIVCGEELNTWRACGRGGNKCKFERAYCKNHGGDERAVEEMVIHHGAEHPEGK